MRRLLEGLAAEGGRGVLVGSDAAAALEDFFAESDRASESHAFWEHYRFDREGLYGDRGAPAG